MTTKYSRNENGEFVCLECGVTKNRQNTMFYHMKKHAGEMSHICPEPGCGKAFIQKSGLQQHTAQMHTPEGVSLWSCPCCSHSCKMKANLVIHIGRKHGAGWIPAMESNGCTGCKKQFTSVTAYYYHAVQCFQAPDDVADKIAIAFQGSDLTPIVKKSQENGQSQSQEQEQDPTPCA